MLSLVKLLSIVVRVSSGEFRFEHQEDQVASRLGLYAGVSESDRSYHRRVVQERSHRDECLRVFEIMGTRTTAWFLSRRHQADSSMGAERREYEPR